MRTLIYGAGPIGQWLALKMAQGQDFQLTTCVVGFAPTVHWQQAALLCWNDADNYVKLSFEASRENRTEIVFLSERGGIRAERSRARLGDRPGRLWLRLIKVGDVYAVASSRDGERFEIHCLRTWKGGDPKFVGLTAIAPGDRPVEIDVSFEFFEVATLSASETEQSSSK